ncbi:MAG: FHA domain-containing protein [Vicinamibacteria bacterium]
MARLRLVPDKGAAVLVEAAEAVVGREPSCNVIVLQSSVSRKHATLYRDGEAFSVEDMSSENGTFVNSHRVANSSLNAGDSLRFGSESFTVEVVADISFADSGEFVSGRTLFSSDLPSSFSETLMGDDEPSEGVAPSATPVEPPKAPRASGVPAPPPPRVEVERPRASAPARVPSNRVPRPLPAEIAPPVEAPSFRATDQRPGPKGNYRNALIVLACLGAIILVELVLAVFLFG